MHLFGFRVLCDTAARHPVLVVSNHTSRWDPMVAMYLINNRARLDGYALMDAKNLRRLPFLGRVGGFGLHLDSARDSAAGIRYAAGLLHRPGRLVWIYPQGGLRPVTAPLAFKPGAALVGKRVPDARVVPCALRYEFGEDEKPDLYVSFGEPRVPERDTQIACSSQQDAVGRELQRIDEHVLEGAHAFERVLVSPTPWLGRVAERWLARLTRYPEIEH